MGDGRWEMGGDWNVIGWDKMGCNLCMGRQMDGRTDRRTDGLMDDNMHSQIKLRLLDEGMK